MKSLISKQPMLAAIVFCLVAASCQKMDRPELKEILYDPEPPTYNPLKAQWSFENNTTDNGESKLRGTTVNTSYVAGVNGQALHFGPEGYFLLTGRDTVTYPNEFVGLSFDSLANPGSLTVAFWMNGTGPIQGGAQGVFSFSNKNTFWGHYSLFLENYSAAGDPSAAHFKLHIENSSVTAGTEQWIEGANMTFTGVLGKWTHMAFVYDAATSALSVYKDGVVTGTNGRVLNGGNYGPLKFSGFNGLVWGTHQFMTTPSLSTGTGAQDWAKGFNGAIDQARIYNKPLSAAEINQLYTSKE